MGIAVRELRIFKDRYRFEIKNYERFNINNKKSNIVTINIS